MNTVINYSDELFHEKIKWCQETGNGYMVEFNTLEEFLNFSETYKEEDTRGLKSLTTKTVGIKHGKSNSTERTYRPDFKWIYPKKSIDIG